ncbi:MAG: hypothetical protein D6741_15395 [Planctomycetota bacterium]|nr:MAG: hypothetical protein D6741_15395 [Planctomycetota bacterium]
MSHASTVFPRMLRPRRCGATLPATPDNHAELFRSLEEKHLQLMASLEELDRKVKAVLDEWTRRPQAPEVQDAPKAQ